MKKEALEVIIPLFNEEACIDALVKRLLALRDELSFLDVSFIFVNDGSTDKSLQMLNSYAESYDFFKVLNLSRNFGHQSAITAGMDYASADYVAVIDADLQDPPEVIEDMYNKAKEGFDIVYGQRISRKGETIFKRITAYLFYKLISKMCDTEIPADTGDFRLINNKVLCELKKLREKNRFIRGMIPWLGFKSTSVQYNRDRRYAGNTKYPVNKMAKFALDAIFSFSHRPLMIAIHVGFVFCGLGVLGVLAILYLKLFTTLTVPGMTSIISTVLIVGGVQTLIIGIIGEYIARIFEESKNRPLYILDKETSKDEKCEF